MGGQNFPQGRPSIPFEGQIDMIVEQSCSKKSAMRVPSSLKLEDIASNKQNSEDFMSD
jgi:hypothetical protein